MADAIEDIKSRLDIVDVVSQYVQLKKLGHNFKGLCPFHGEKTPSFVVSQDKQICHCFGCNKGGDIFTFIEEIEGIPFNEALALLADKAGVKLEKKEFSKKVSDEKEQYFQAHQWACEFFEDQLFKSAEGKKVLDYLYRRGLTDETIKNFRVGFAPDSYDALFPYLLKKSVSKDVLLKSGFVSAKNLASNEIYDKFRGRLMFPIFDYLGRICGFGGRALKKDQSPKYLNSPENPVYSKSKVLYGFSDAKKAIKEQGFVVLVEGYFDFLMPYQAGIQNVVATSGTALTKEHARMLKRVTANAVTSFDTDNAGFEATKRAYNILQEEGISVKTIGFNEKDPADFILENGGEKFKENVASATDFFSFYIAKLIKDFDITSISGRKGLISEVLPYYKRMTAATRDFYVKELSASLNVDAGFLYDEIASFDLPMDHPARNSGQIEAKNGFKITTEQLVLAIVLAYPDIFSQVSVFLNENDFSDEMKNIYKLLTDQYNSQSKESRVTWNFEEFSSLMVFAVYAEEKYSLLSQEKLVSEVKQLIGKMRTSKKDERLAELLQKIAEAEKNEDKELLMDLLREQQQILS